MAKALNKIDMMRALIGTPSVSSTNTAHDQSNLEVISTLANWLENLGFRVTVQVLPGQAKKANLIATLGEIRADSEGLVLSGHTDTVPYNDTNWLQDPFTLTEKDGNFYGLGSTDMKSFFALALDVASEFSHSKLKQPLTILATADEESTMTGAQALLREQLQHAKYAIIGEPTDLTPVHMHKGVMMESLVVSGKAGHSSDPSLGASATEGMQKILNELLLWRAELQQTYQNPAFTVNVPTLNIGSIHGGDNPNRICAHCETQIDIRPLPGMNINSLRADMQTRLKNVFNDYVNLSFQHRPLFNGVAPFETAKDAKLTQLTEQLSGQSAIAVAFGTEAPYLTSLGLETIIIGPGSINQAHQPNEFIPQNQINPYCDFLRKLIHKICL